MGWDTSAVFVAGRKSAEVLALLAEGVAVEPSGDPVTGDVATSLEGINVLYAAETGNWCQVWDPCGGYAMNGTQTLASGGTRALGVLFASLSGTYGFFLIEDGAVVRNVIVCEGELAVDEGEPLPAESTIDMPFGLDDDSLWAVIEAVTGLTFQFEQMYTVHPISVR